MQGKLKVELPDLYLSEEVDDETFKKLINQGRSVIKKIFMLKHEVKPDYYFLDYFDNEYDISGKVIPNFVFAGKAKSQLENSKLSGLFKSETAYYKIKVSVYKSNSYEKVWEFEEMSRDKNKIYKLIVELIKNIENKIENNDFKNWKQGRDGEDITDLVEYS